MVGEQVSNAIYHIDQAIDALAVLLDTFDMSGVDNTTSTDVALVYSRLHDLIVDLEVIADDV